MCRASGLFLCAQLWQQRSSGVAVDVRRLIWLCVSTAETVMFATDSTVASAFAPPSRLIQPVKSNSSATCARLATAAMDLQGGSRARQGCARGRMARRKNVLSNCRAAWQAGGCQMRPCTHAVVPSDVRGHGERTAPVLSS